MRRSLLGRHRRQAGEGHVEIFLVVMLVVQLAGGVVHIGRHVEVSVTAEIEQDGAAAAFPLASAGFFQGRRDRVFLDLWEPYLERA